MYKGKKILAIIPARKGSKRIKNKNLFPFKKKPLIYFTFTSALKSKIIDEIIISSNDTKIIEYSKRFNVKIPFIRPNNISTSKSKASDVIIHTINWLKNNTSQAYDYIIYLQPTSPNRRTVDIDRALKIVINQNIKTLVSASKSSYPINWMFSKNKNKKFYSFKKSKMSNKLSQEYADYYYLNGSIFIAKIDYFIKYKTFYTNKTYIYETPFINSIDIDYLNDLKLAEKLN